MTGTKANVHYSDKSSETQAMNNSTRLSLQLMLRYSSAVSVSRPPPTLPDTLQFITLLGQPKQPALGASWASQELPFH